MRSYGLKNPICIIPNGMTLHTIERSSRPVWHKQVQANKKTLLYLGRIHPKKGLANLLRAWAVCNGCKTSPAADWELVIAGWDQGSHQQDLLTLVETLGISNSVHFVGPQFGDEKSTSYSYADAFVLPSYSEGLPMVVLEAWSYGLPVVMTPECNIPEAFQHGSAIEVATNFESISGGLDRLFNLTSTQRLEMGARGRSLVEDRFVWSVIGSQMAGVYDWILGSGPRPACVSAI